MSMEKLIEPRPAAFGSIRYLRFIEALNLAEAAKVLADQAALRRQIGEYFRPGIGRLARGGFLPRLADGLFSLSFLLRGHLPAADMAAAELDYNAIREEHPEHVYYGRVTHQAGWTILQYWFFFYSNPWRSGFHGVNDHESDWEMVTLYLYEDGGQLVPEWAAYASHDFHGDDLRRRWDDKADLTIENGHPVVHAGAGSHSSYFRRGEYQAGVSLPLPGWMAGLLQSWNNFWTETLGQPAVNAFHVPFVDYARGDGLRIGPDGPQAWSPVLIDESTAWVSQYRGLWGLFARDPISGENAPAGPMYNRDGTPRGSWYDPLGFAGLDKVPPPPQALQMLSANCQKVSQRQAELEKSIPQKAEQLQALGIKAKGMVGNPHLAKQYAALEKELATLSNEVRALRREFFRKYRPAAGADPAAGAHAGRGAGGPAGAHPQPGRAGPPQPGAALRPGGRDLGGRQPEPAAVRDRRAGLLCPALHLGRAGGDPDPVRDGRVDPAGRLRPDGRAHHPVTGDAGQRDPVDPFLEVDAPGGAAGDGGVVDGVEAEGAGGIRGFTQSTRRSTKEKEKTSSLCVPL